MVCGFQWICSAPAEGLRDHRQDREDRAEDHRDQRVADQGQLRDLHAQYFQIASRDVEFVKQSIVRWNLGKQIITDDLGVFSLSLW